MSPLPFSISVLQVVFVVEALLQISCCRYFNFNSVYIYLWLALFQNELEVFYFHTINWFRVQLTNTNNSLQYLYFFLLHSKLFSRSINTNRFT